jgi:mono/diheme cytochrome c family protein
MRITAFLLICVAAGAQVSTSVWDGIYTSGQAKRGEPLYKQKCASCHGDALDGSGQAPALSGAEFRSNWNGQTVGDLFDKMQATMPGDNPGSLSKDQNADILALMLKVNEFPAGAKDLRGDLDELKKIHFEAKK